VISGGSGAAHERQGGGPCEDMSRIGGALARPLSQDHTTPFPPHPLRIEHDLLDEINDLDLRERSVPHQTHDEFGKLKG
jgi:hypothetical protein